MTRTLWFSIVIGSAVLLAGCMNPFTGRNTSSHGAASKDPAAGAQAPERTVASSVSTLFTDNFNRADSADIGNGWIEKTPSVFSLQNNSVVKVQSSDYRDCVVYRPSGEAIRDVQAQDTFVNTASTSYNGYPQVWVRIQSDTAATANTLTGYVLYLPNSATVAELSRQIGTTDVQTMTSISLSPGLQPGGRYRLTLQAVGANPVQLDAEIDAYNGSTWQAIGTASYTDSSTSQITTAGVTGFGGDTEVGDFAYDSFTYGVPAGSPMPSQWPPATVSFTDDFNRADSPDIGNGWTEKNPSVFSLQNGTVVKAASSDYRANIVYRPSTEDLADVEDSVEFVDTSTDSNSPGYPQIWARVQRDTVSTVNTLDGYILYIYDSPTTAYIGRQTGTSYVVWLQQITLSQPIQPGGRYRLVLSVQGTNPVQLEGSIDQYSGSTWQTIGNATVTDSASNRITTAGTMGFAGSVNAGLYAYDNFAYGPIGSSPPPNQPPTAGFTYSCSGLTCNFTNTSSDSDGSIASSSWDFGDGGTSTATSPSYTYSSAGTYTVGLTVTDNSGAQSSTSQSVTVSTTNQPPTAGFTYSCSGLTCSFTNTSSDSDGSIASSSWDFGDGGTSTATSPSYTYSSAGTYTVGLTVTDDGGAQSSTSQSVTVSAPANQPPTAGFTYSCSGLTCSFTNTSSDSDGSIASSSWSFGDGGTSTATSPSYTYSSAGTYTVGLTVTDNSGAQSSTSQSVTVSAPANQPPTASFSYNCSGLTCNFTNTSSDSDGSIASSSWNFGDGGTSTATSPSYTYSSAGTYTVGLTVTDNGGAQNSTSQSVTVTAPNQPPTASFSYNCSGLTCNFTNTSSDSDGSIASSSWNFGDGNTSTATSPSHSYNYAGTYSVSLTVTDNSGAQDSTSQSVTVTAPNQPPTASFSYSCSGLTCNFTNSSSDSDGSIASSSWNFGDGNTSTATSPSHSYSYAGTYSVSLTVTDNSGAQDSTSQSVTVTAPNQPPTASFGYNCSGLTCNFTNSSSDSDGSIASSSWNFGDGGTSSATSPSHTYGSAGTYNVSLTVTDNSGAQNSTSHSVTVTAPNQPPVAAFTDSCNGLACSFTDQSYDTDGYIVSWYWDFGDGSTSTQQNPTHTYSGAGNYMVNLTVTDNDGATDTIDPPALAVGPPNVPPVVTAGPDTTVLLGSLYTLAFGFVDPGDSGPWSYTIQWGDGTTSSGTAQHAGPKTATHSYPAGLLTSERITVTVTDSHGASGSDSKTVTIVANLLGGLGL